MTYPTTITLEPTEDGWTASVDEAGSHFLGDAEGITSSGATLGAALSGVAGQLDALEVARRNREARREQDLGPIKTLLLLVEHSIPRVTPAYGDGLEHVLGEGFPTDDEILGWSQQVREDVCEWASSVHLRASDNDDVEVPECPRVLRSCARCSKPLGERGGIVERDAETTFHEACWHAQMRDEGCVPLSEARDREADRG